LEYREGTGLAEITTQGEAVELKGHEPASRTFTHCPVERSYERRDVLIAGKL
jgi:hypothetical protein